MACSSGPCRMGTDPDLLAIRRGMITAPAGCGKTHAIVSALERHRPTKPILVLTHTNAGVAALRGRLRELKLLRKAYRLATIDGWALQLVHTFPMRSGYRDSRGVRKPDYPTVREHAKRLLASGHIARVLAASYDRMLVDEYQDCSTRQHRMLASAAEVLPTVALGDPLQAIFAFGKRDPLPDWGGDVCRVFPVVGELHQPWRWRNAGNDALGCWLREVREALLEGRHVDLASRPDCVRWVRLQGGVGDHGNRRDAARCRERTGEQTALVIGDSRSPDSRSQIAKTVPGVATVEPVDLGPLIDFAARLDEKPDDRLVATVEFASGLMTSVAGRALLKRVEVLKRGRVRKQPDEVEKAALHLSDSPTPASVADLLEACARRSGSRVYRPGILWPAIRALRSTGAGPDSRSCVEAAVKVREAQRAMGRGMPRHGIGSTLLLKGLEADHAVILDADALDAKNLYVALTRATRSLTICSSSPELVARHAI